MAEDFPYRDGKLHAEAVPLARLAAEIGTPFYVYSAAGFAGRYHRFAAAFAAERPLICYAVKANSNLAVLRLFAGLGAGADVVSEGELRRALAAGVPPDRIVFSGVGKTRAEVDAALAAGIRQINIESIPELKLIAQVAAGLGRKARIALRVNPDVDALTHAKISTGKKENKFGIDLDDAIAAYRLAMATEGVEPVGLAVHIGSQVTDLAPYRDAFERVAALAVELRAQGLPVHGVDLGGGLGIGYRGEPAIEPADHAALVRSVFGPLRLDLTLEPGRVLTGPAGLLVARVLFVKEGRSRRFIVVDAAMNDLIRPALYNAWHQVLPVRLPAPGTVLSPADVVGPVCESGDTFAVDRDLPPFCGDDLIAFADAGAYGAVMSSTYNSRLLVPEVLVSGERFAVIRPRPSYAALLAQDVIPAWLAEGTR